MQDFLVLLSSCLQSNMSPPPSSTPPTHPQ
uniref:Uncharacterized protein n=1 Tax=Anguilla anguilla TaxID=7936 RepID=A0A0E9QP94_ANGAN